MKLNNVNMNNPFESEQAMNAIKPEESWETEPNFRMQKLQQEQQEATPAEKRFLKALHWMRCPKCGQALTTERHGSVDIDVCSGCRAVCLDAVALEAIVTPENDFLRSCLRNLHHLKSTGNQA